MKKKTIIRAFFGLMVVALGGILLLQNLDIIKDNVWHIYWGIFWGSVFVMAGLSLMSSQRLAWIWGVLLMAIGVSIALNLFGVIDISVWKIFWPALLIIIGLGVMFQVKPARRKKLSSPNKDTEKVAIFYGEESRVKGDYAGGSLSAVFGGVELDLRQAKIKDGTVIEVFTLCGAIDITLPDDVVVKNEVRGILGGSEDKSMPKASAKKTLYVRGECILGGLELK